MKNLSATASGIANAPIERCFEMLSDVGGYARWYPAGVKESEVLERGPDGRPSRVKTTLSLNQGPIQRDFKLHLGVREQQPNLVELIRLAKSADDREEMRVIWRLAPSGAGTQITVELSARLSIPGFLPVGGVADGLARGFLDAALAAVGQ
jgi:hypothetical protein